MLFLWTLLIGLVTVNLISAQKSRPIYWNKLMMLFESPFSVPRHIDLAALLWRHGQTQNARQLMASVRPANVLGATSNTMTILDQWENETQKIKEQYVFWQSVAASNPDYRDAYVALTVLSFELGKTDEARAWLAKAQTINPNSLTVQKLREYLR